jgi:hypothetical protein
MSAIIAKLLNSTVGTSSTKALDTILKTDNTTIANNAADRLYGLFNNNAKLVAADEILYVYSGTWSSNDSSIFGSQATGYKTLNYISFDKSGTVRLVFSHKNTSSSETSAYLRVYDGSGSQIATITEYVKANTSVEVSLDVNVTAGSKYKVAVGYSNSVGGSSNLRVCAKTIICPANVTLTT